MDGLNPTTGPFQLLDEVYVRLLRHTCPPYVDEQLGKMSSHVLIFRDELRVDRLRMAVLPSTYRVDHFMALVTTVDQEAICPRQLKNTLDDTPRRIAVTTAAGGSMLKLRGWK